MLRTSPRPLSGKATNFSTPPCSTPLSESAVIRQLELSCGPWARVRSQLWVNGSRPERSYRQGKATSGQPTLRKLSALGPVLSDFRVYSPRTATIGSTRSARRAGIKPAVRATLNKKIELSANAAGFIAPARIWLEATEGARYT